MLLAIMNILVLVLPLYQLLLDVRKPLNTVRVKAAESFRNIRQRLGSRSGARDLTAKDPPKVGDCELVSTPGKLRVACSPTFCRLCLEGVYCSIVFQQDAAPAASDGPVNSDKSEDPEQVQFALAPPSPPAGWPSPFVESWSDAYATRFIADKYLTNCGIRMW